MSSSHSDDLFSPAPSLPVNFAQALKQRWAEGFTPMTTTPVLGEDGDEVTLDVVLEDNTFHCCPSAAAPGPSHGPFGPSYWDGKSQEEAAMLSSLLSSIFEAGYESPPTLSDDFISHELCRMISGSNKIEGFCSDFETVKALCMPIFRSGGIPPLAYPGGWTWDVVERHLRDKGIPYNTGSIRRCQQEIVNHALAAVYLLDHIVVKGGEIGVFQLKETYGKLVAGIDMRHPAGPGFGTQWGYTPGERFAADDFPAMIRRTIDENKLTTFLRDHIYFPLRQRLETDVALGFTDPVATAAWYGQKMKWYRENRGGDGRLERLLVNALLLKYGGVMVPLGAGDDEGRNAELRELLMPKEQTLAMLMQAEGADPVSASARHRCARAVLGRYILQEVYCTMRRWRKELQGEEGGGEGEAREERQGEGDKADLPVHHAQWQSA